MKCWNKTLWPVICTLLNYLVYCSKKKTIWCKISKKIPAESTKQMITRRLPSTAASFSWRRLAGLPNLARTRTSLQSLSVFPNKIGLIAFCSTPEISAEYTDTIPQPLSKQVTPHPLLQIFVAGWWVFSVIVIVIVNVYVWFGVVLRCRVLLNPVYTWSELPLETSKISPYGTPSLSFTRKTSVLASSFLMWWWLEFRQCRALRVLKSAHVILSEDTRHSGKLLHHYNIKTPLVSPKLFWGFSLIA